MSRPLSWVCWYLVVLGVGSGESGVHAGLYIYKRRRKALCCLLTCTLRRGRREREDGSWMERIRAWATRLGCLLNGRTGREGREPSMIGPLNALGLCRGVYAVLASRRTADGKRVF